MIKKILTLFKIARKIAQSEVINIVAQFHEIPKTVKFFSFILSFSFSNSKKLGDQNTNEEEQLCNSIQEMGTTFIKLGQFLSTRPDIIGNEISKKLEKLQDKLPPFSNEKANNIIASISSLKIFLIFGLKIFIATFFTVPLSFI